MKDDDAIIYVCLPVVGHILRCVTDFRRDTEALPLNLVFMLLPRLLDLVGIQSSVIHCPQ